MSKKDLTYEESVSPEFIAKGLRDLANKADYAPDVSTDGSNQRFISAVGLADFLHTAADLIDPNDLED